MKNTLRPNANHYQSNSFSNFNAFAALTLKKPFSQQHQHFPTQPQASKSAKTKPLLKEKIAW